MSKGEFCCNETKDLQLASLQFINQGETLFFPKNIKFKKTALFLKDTAPTPFVCSGHSIGMNSTGGHSIEIWVSAHVALRISLPLW